MGVEERWENNFLSEKWALVIMLLGKKELSCGTIDPVHGKSSIGGQEVFPDKHRGKTMLSFSGKEVDSKEYEDDQHNEGEVKD